MSLVIRKPCSFPLLVGIVSALVCGAVGCSRGGKAPTFDVTGTVKLPDGTPLAGGRLLFRPINAEYSARADIREDGSFELSTFGLGDGAVEGKHRVMVVPPVPKDFMDNPHESSGPRIFIDLSYQNLRTTPLEYEVVKGGGNHFEIVVEPPHKSRTRKR